METSDFKWESADEIEHHRYVWPAVRALLPAAKGRRILDLGCGNGYISGRLHEMGHHVVGIDLSNEGIELARNRNPDVRYEVASVYDDLSSLEPSGWNVVLASEVIEHLFDPPRFLNNVYGLLNSGGHLILTTPYHGFLKNLAISVIDGWDRHFTVARVGGHIKFFSARTLKEMLQAAGFVRPVFNNAGRLPFLWKSMVCRVERV